MAPDPYAAYLVTGKKGRARVERLPAADDPMMARVAAIRERDHMLVDTLNEYYADFYARMDRPYDDWRAYSYDEQNALDSINRAVADQEDPRRDRGAGRHLLIDPSDRRHGDRRTC